MVGKTPSSASVATAAGKDTIAPHSPASLLTVKVPLIGQLITGGVLTTLIVASHPGLTSVRLEKNSRSIGPPGNGELIAGGKVKPL